MKPVFIFISLLIMLCPAFSQSRMEHYLDSLGLVNVGRMDPTLKIDLMYTRADNFTGKVLYEGLQEAYLHPEAAKAFSSFAFLINRTLCKRASEFFSMITARSGFSDRKSTRLNYRSH